jgi:hypothetical protein
MKKMQKILVGTVFIALLVVVTCSVTASAYTQSSLPQTREQYYTEMIQSLMEQLAILQAQLRAVQATERSDPEGNWSSGDGVGASDGPKYNAKDCSASTNSNIANGKLACYGLWDYGNEFGEDQSACGGIDAAYDHRKPTGCVIPAKMCASDKAIAARFYSVSSASEEKIAELALNLKASKTAVKEQLINIWEYDCTSLPLTDLNSEIDVSSLEKDYGGLNPDWDFVDAASDIVIVGAYEPAATNNTVTVNISNVNPGTLLVLTSYESINWKLTGTDLNDIEGIFVTGYEDQGISGVPSDVEITSSIYEVNHSEDGLFYAYEKESPEFYQLQDYLHDKTGFKPTRFFGQYSLSQVTVK